MQVARRTSSFESLVNTEGIQTQSGSKFLKIPFESLVNTEGIQTRLECEQSTEKFESLVNTEGIQTVQVGKN